VEKMCKALNLKRGAYYSWTQRKKSARKREDDILAVEIKRIHNMCPFGLEHSGYYCNLYRRHEIIL